MSLSANNIVKCASCTIMICEVLAFIKNKLDVMDVENLIPECVTGFSAGDMEEAKTLLFKSLPGLASKIISAENISALLYFYV